MPNPDADFPAAVHVETDLSGFGGSPLGSTTPKQTEIVGKLEKEVVELQTKVGIGAPGHDGTPKVFMSSSGTNPANTGFQTLSEAGIAASGHVHAASQVVVDQTNLNSFVGANVQAIIEFADVGFTNARSTGISAGGGLTDQGGGTVRIAAGTGAIIDDPNYTQLSWDQTDVDLSGVDQVHYIYVDANGDVLSTTTAPDNDDYRTAVWLWRVSIRSNAVAGTLPIPQPVRQLGPQIHDVFTAIGDKKEGLAISAASTDLTFQYASGSIYSPGVNFFTDIKDPHRKSISAQSPVTFQHVDQDNDRTADTTALDVGNYDNAGTITAIPGASSRAQIFTVFLSPNSLNVRVLYGQEFYTTVAEAFSALNAGEYNPTVPNQILTATNLIGWIIAEKGATNLADGTQIFVSSSRDGTIGGAVASAGANALLASNNLSDVNDAATARSNLSVADKTGDSYTGDHDFGAARLEVPNGSPSINNAGDLGIRTTVSGFQGLPVYHDGTREMSVLSVPTATLQTTASGQMFKYDGANGLVPAADNEGGGGGSNAYGATYTIGTGGDYADISAWHADAPAANDVLVILDNITESAAFTWSTNNVTVIGAHPGVTITFSSSSNSTLSGSNWQFRNISMNKTSSGRITFTGTDMVWDKVNYSGTNTTSLQIYFTGEALRIVNSRIDTEALSNASARYFFSQSENSIIANNFFDCAYTSNETTHGHIAFDANYCSVTGNTFRFDQGSLAGAAVGVNGNRMSFTGNSIESTTSSQNGAAILINGTQVLVTGNNTYNFKWGCYVITGNHVISGNSFDLANVANAAGVYLSAVDSCSVTGNFIAGGNTTDVGIELVGDSDYNAIVGNVGTSLLTTMVSIAATGDNNVVIGNAGGGAGTLVSDSGTGTLFQTATDSDPLNTN